MDKDRRCSKKRLAVKCGGWEMMFQKTDLEMKKFWRDELGLMAVFSDGNIKVGDEIWEE
ncbi:MAG: hypothetical protein BWY26_01260 [Elusimicrobia bacterium ADurb.Bin231]|nr:MAG: hypothetical protein BWY26_01260 [Elusimicrobia bacterium ADurb.Bin231]